MQCGIHALHILVEKTVYRAFLGTRVIKQNVLYNHCSSRLGTANLSLVVLFRTTRKEHSQEEIMRCNITL